MERRYHVIHVSKDGQSWRRMNDTPMTHAEACTFKAKTMRPAEHQLREVTEPCGCALGRYGVSCNEHAWRAGVGRVFDVLVNGEWLRIAPEQYRVAADGSLSVADVLDDGAPLHGYGPRTHLNQRGWSRGGWREAPTKEG